ncbi:MAG: tetratricopeptide repeat protein [Pyrinomonadaceae bacterium]
MKTASILIIFVLVFFALIASPSAQSRDDELRKLAAQLEKNPKDKSLLKKFIELSPSVKKGDPPPGDALKMTSGIARIVLRDLLQKRYLVSNPKLLSPGFTFFESKEIRITREALSFEFDFFDGKKRETRRWNVVFKRLDYGGFGQWPESPDRLFFVTGKGLFGDLGADLLGFYVLTWREERDAKRFSDALNRLTYEANQNTTAVDNDLLSFATSTRLWREKSESRPVAPDGWDRHRILAEQGIKDKDFVAALVNYEAGLETYPLWAQGWFNAALLYAELGEFESAANRMKHYLLLVPDAPDAKAAREKTIIWEDKAKQ